MKTVRSSINRIALIALTTTALLGGALPAAAIVESQGSATTAASSTTAAARVVLQTLTCYETEDTSGGDELYIVVGGQTIWTAEDTVDCDHDAPRTLAVNRQVNVGATVALYDADSGFLGQDDDDFLGSDIVDIVEGQTGSLVFNMDDALYTLSYVPA